MRLPGFAIGVALALSASAAEARMHAPYRGHRIVPVATGALDGFTQPAAAYSFRKVRSAYSGFAVKLRRTTGGTQDIGFVGNDFDTAAAAAFCAATTCFVDTWYDQTGLGRHMTQATAANQPQLNLSCNGTLPCLELTNGKVLAFAGQTPNAVLTLNAVARHAAYPGGGTTACQPIGYGSSNWLQQHANFDLMIMTNGSATINATATRLAWHSFIGVYNGASAVNSVDGVDATGTLSAATGVGSVFTAGVEAGNTCQQTEAVVWNGYALTPAERTALTQNQRNYWMPLPLDTFTTPTGAYSFRKLKSTYSGPAIRLRRASDNAELDINFLGFVPGIGAPLDVVAANAHCAATSCFLRTWYDQSGGARDLGTATPAGQPQYIENCNGSLPCVRFTAAAHVILGPSFTPATSIATLNVVAHRAAGGATGAVMLRSNGNAMRLSATAANTWALGAAAISVAATDGVWHSGIGMMVTTAGQSVLGIDGTETTGTTVPVLTAGTPGMLGVDGAVLSIAEAIFWDGYTSTATERTALQANQKSFWGTP